MELHKLFSLALFFGDVNKKNGARIVLLVSGYSGIGMIDACDIERRRCNSQVYTGRARNAGLEKAQVGLSGRGTVRY